MVLQKKNLFYFLLIILKLLKFETKKNDFIEKGMISKRFESSRY